MRKIKILNRRKDRGWISADERLPKDYVPILLYVPDRPPLLSPVVEGYLAPTGRFYQTCGGCGVIVNATHWRPMPAPPKDA